MGGEVSFFFSSRRRHTRSDRDWSSDVCSSDLTVTGSSVPCGPRSSRRIAPSGSRSAGGTSGSSAPGAPVRSVATPRGVVSSPDMHDIPQLIVSTILLGGIYALIAVGLTLIFGVMRVVNFAHGEFLMLAMYVAFWAFSLLRSDPYLTLVVSLPLFFAAG